MKKLKSILISFMVLFGISITALTIVDSVSAVNVTEETCKVEPDNIICEGKSEDLGVILNTVVDVLLYILGIISVIVLIIGGIRYTTSQGDPKTVETAKNTILYAIIGIGIAFSAYAIVHWVVGRF